MGNHMDGHTFCRLCSKYEKLVENVHCQESNENMGNHESTLRATGTPDSDATTPNDATTQQESTRECPVPEEYRNTAIYNVYNQRIDGRGDKNDPWMGRRQDILDPKNNMPLEANQQPCPGQKDLLSTQRVQSNIPKGGTDTTWLYPSPQMFYNALKRKGKGDDVSEDDMESVVAAHNTLNEVTWNHVWSWEQLHKDECGGPMLLRFAGRPHDLSPLARIYSWFGGPLPFDRHDWYVDRCGKEVRYVIDFYFDDAKAGSPEAFDLVVRPALDSPEAALDRVKMYIYRTFAAYGLPCPVTGHSSSSSSSAVGSSPAVGTA